MTSALSGKLSSGNLGGLKTRKARDIKAKPSIMIYGGSGIGKSTFACSSIEVPEMGPVLSINIENGMGESISEAYPDVDVVDVETFAELQSVFDVLNRTRNDEAGTVGTEGWRTVIIDNMTESQKQGMAHLFPGASSPKFADVLTGSWGDGTWNKNSEQMRVLIRAMRQLPVYTIFIAWERDISKPDTALTNMVPSFSPSFAAEAPGMLNDVFYYHFSRDNTRLLETARSNKWTAKDRTGKLPATLIDPKMSDLWAYWSGQKIASNDQANATTSENGANRLTPRRAR
jgi:hypothetical protein